MYENRKNEIENYKEALDRLEKSIREKNKSLLFDSEVHDFLVNLNVEIHQLNEENEDEEYNRHIRNIKRYTSKLMKVIKKEREKMKEEKDFGTYPYL